MKMKDRILRHLQQYGSITSWEAIMEYGCTRLSEYIRQLRIDNNIISEWQHTKNRYNEPTKFVKYTLVK